MCTIFFYRFNNNYHTDFVRGLAWQQDGYMISCGWDGRISRHHCPDLSDSCSNGVSMEVNLLHSDEKENHGGDMSVKTMQKADLSNEQLNGINRSITSSEGCQ